MHDCDVEVGVVNQIGMVTFATGRLSTQLVNKSKHKGRIQWIDCNLGF